VAAIARQEVAPFSETSVHERLCECMPCACQRFAGLCLAGREVCSQHLLEAFEMFFERRERAEARAVLGALLRSGAPQGAWRTAGTPVLTAIGH
jgi:hypothetical protein